MKKYRLPIRLDRADYRIVKQTAKKLKISAAEYIRRLIRGGDKNAK